MKKIGLKSWSVVILFLLCIGVVVIEGIEIFRLKNAPCCCERNSLINFQDTLELFSEPEYRNVREVRTSESATNAAKQLWAEKGYNEIDESSIMATFCSKYHFWFIRETSSIFDTTLGVSAMALIRPDGEVLAVWMG